MYETISDSDDEYAEATQILDLKELEWNVFESPVFKFKSHGHKFAFQFTLTDTEKMRRLFAEKQQMQLLYPYDVTFNCLKAPSNCRLRVVKICCVQNNHELFRLDLNNLPGPYDCPIVKPASRKFPLLCGGRECMCCSPPDAPRRRPPGSYSVTFEILIQGDLVVHSEKWTFASPWLEVPNAPLMLRTYLTGSFYNGLFDHLNMELEFKTNDNSVSVDDDLHGVSICVTGFDRKNQDTRQLSSSATYKWPVSLPMSPNGTTLKIAVGSNAFKQPIMRIPPPNFEMFIAVVSKTDVHSDCTLRIVDEVFPVHKAVLDVFPYFKGKFNVDGAEKPTIDLPSEMLPESAIELIRYIYTREVENLDSVAEDLIKVANELMLDELKQICTSALQSKLCVENVLSLLVMADKMQCESLKDSAKLFLRKDLSGVKEYSEDMWKEFLRGNADLAAFLVA